MPHLLEINCSTSKIKSTKWYICCMCVCVSNLVLELSNLVSELADVLSWVGVVQLTLDQPLLLLEKHILHTENHRLFIVTILSNQLSHTYLHTPTWISSSAIFCLSSAMAAILSASLSRTAITSSLPCMHEGTEGGKRRDFYCLKADVNTNDASEPALSLSGHKSHDSETLVLLFSVFPSLSCSLSFMLC